MHVIEQNDNWTSRVTCGGCASVLEIDPTDVLRHSAVHSSDQRENAPASFYITCPVCHQEHPLDTALLPGWVKDRADDPTIPYSQSR